MLTIDGKSHLTIVDAARELGVSPKTVREWVQKEIISKPEEIEYGVRMVQIFTKEFLRKAKDEVRHHRENQKKLKVARSDKKL